MTYTSLTHNRCRFELKLSQALNHADAYPRSKIHIIWTMRLNCDTAVQCPSMVYRRWDKRSRVTARTAGRKLDFVATTATQLRLFISRSSSRTTCQNRTTVAAARQFICRHCGALYARHFRDVAVGLLYMDLQWKSTVDASVFLWFAKAYSRRIATLTHIASRCLRSSRDRN